jgi:hypothetical protein
MTHEEIFTAIYTELNALRSEFERLAKEAPNEKEQIHKLANMIGVEHAIVTVREIDHKLLNSNTNKS